MKENKNNTNRIKEVSLELASPDHIKKWSYGEVTKSETINYRTGRSERNGLFDARIFGPEKDYECYCGKYKGIRYKDIVCEKCGVEVTRTIVRRSRMGHIELASPVAHIWFLRSIPSRIGLILNIGIKDLEKVVYFAGYILVKVHEDQRERALKDLESEFKTKLKSLKTQKDKEALQDLFTETRKEIHSIQPNIVLSEEDFHKFSVKYSTLFDAEIGAEAIYKIFKEINLEKLITELKENLETTKSAAVRKKVEKRLSLAMSLYNAKLRPEWMFMTIIPIIPPAMRPMVALEGGRYATSDVNDLYRRVINRNNRLKKLIAINAPAVILRNEKRILQEAVDALIDNTVRRSSGNVAMSQSKGRALKSLSDNLKGKQGLLRQNLLGKRVDYSGRSVIVVGPRLKLDECGLPKYMALELFKPFVMAKIIERELAYNVRGASRFVEEATPEVWEILEEVIQEKYVLLNRAPTLHRLSIQAFHPVLIEGKAIQVHPLVCASFNADFDGDQMAVHLPLSAEAQKEAKELMASDKNLLKPQSGDPIISPSQDMVLGVFWMTHAVSEPEKRTWIFSSTNEAIMAYEFDLINFRTKILVQPTETEKYEQFEGKYFETTVGRLLFNSTLPSDFGYINETVDNKKLSKIVSKMILEYGVEIASETLDKIKNFGYRYVTRSGITWGFRDMKVPEAKGEIIKKARGKEKEIYKQYNDGVISDTERYKKILEVWEAAILEVRSAIEDGIPDAKSIRDIIVSGARGSVSNMLQMTGMKGIIQNTEGRPIDFPVVNSYIEGLSPVEYFITTHGSRKGLADTALNTAKAGYLTRRLHDVSQDVVVTEKDCGTKNYVIAKEENIDGIIKTLADRLYGRALAEDIKDKDGKIIYKKNDVLYHHDAKKIEDTGIKEVKVRSVRTCETLYGVCQHCYGLDLGRNHLVKLGEAVGTISAQAIGEPGTQLTLRTFHAGGVAGVDITTGLPRVEEIFERRSPKAEATIAGVDGTISGIEKGEGNLKIITVLPDKPDEKKKDNVKRYEVGYHRTITVKSGDHIKKGDLLTDGSANITDLFKIAGIERAQDYIVYEIERVYELHGAPVAQKHIEMVSRQMFSRVKIASAGDTIFVAGEIIENIAFVTENEKMTAAGKKPATGKKIVMGITEVALTTESWLSSSSFQHTTRVLVSGAVRGAKDHLRGLKENIIVGNPIPAGTGHNDEFIESKEELKKK